jgi:hypothetical protein
MPIWQFDNSIILCQYIDVIIRFLSPAYAHKAHYITCHRRICEKGKHIEIPRCTDAKEKFQMATIDPQGNGLDMSMEYWYNTVDRHPPSHLCPYEAVPVVIVAFIS